MAQAAATARTRTCDSGSVWLIQRIVQEFGVAGTVRALVGLFEIVRRCCRLSRYLRIHGTTDTLPSRWQMCSTASRHTRRPAGWAVCTTPQHYSACMTNAGQIWTVAGVNRLHAPAHFNNFVQTACQLSTTHTLECAHKANSQATLQPAQRACCESCNALDNTTPRLNTSLARVSTPGVASLARAASGDMYPGVPVGE